MANREDIIDPMGHEETEEDKTKEIDLLEIAKTLWRRKKTIGIWCGIGAIVGLIIAFSIPKEYTTQVKLAPEIAENKGGSGSLGALAPMAGMGNNVSGTDAVYPNLYPDVLKSVPFCVSLFDVPLTDKKGERKFTLREFLEEDTKAPWWSAIMSLPGDLIGAILPSDDNGEDGEETKANPFRLTKKEDSLVKTINERITATVDQKTFVVTVNVNMQDPVVSAILADTVVNRLREYVTNYRTNKARQDMYYLEKLNDEAKDAYYKAQQRFADYQDSHQGVMLYSARTMRDRLENEATLAFNMYNSTSQQLQRAKAKVQEVTPVYTEIEPATVPVKASAPRKVMILAGCIFLAFVASAAWVLFIRPETTSLGQVGEEGKSDEKTSKIND